MRVVRGTPGLTVAMVDPLDAAAVGDLQFQTGLAVACQRAAGKRPDGGLRCGDGRRSS